MTKGEKGAEESPLIGLLLAQRKPRGAEACQLRSSTLSLSLREVAPHPFARIHTYHAIQMLVRVASPSWSSKDSLRRLAGWLAIELSSFLEVACAFSLQSRKG